MVLLNFYFLYSRLDQKRDKNTDVWALGLLMYYIIYGTEPDFINETSEYRLVEKIKSSRIGKVEMDFPNRPEVLEEAKQLISKSLMFEKKDRFTLKELVNANLYLLENTVGKNVISKIDIVIEVTKFLIDLSLQLQNNTKLGMDFQDVCNELSDYVKAISLERIVFLKKICNWENEKVEKSLSSFLSVDTSDLVYAKKNSLFFSNIVTKIGELDQTVKELPSVNLPQIRQSGKTLIKKFFLLLGNSYRNNENLTKLAYMVASLATYKTSLSTLNQSVQFNYSQYTHNLQNEKKKVLFLLKKFLASFEK